MENLNEIKIQGKLKIFKERMELKNNVETVTMIMKIWIRRSKILKKVGQLIGRIMEKSPKKTCEFCGVNWGLTSDLENSNLEDLMQTFLKNNKINYIRLHDFQYKDREKKYSDIDAWQNYFQKHSRLTSRCFECNEICYEEYK